MQWYLFTMDSHRNYMIANFIVFCMKYLINLFILFPHTLHLFQLLAVNVFTLLKCALVKEIDAIFQLDFSAFRMQIESYCLFELNHKFQYPELCFLDK